MYDETEERMRKERETTKRAECFARLVLADLETTRAGSARLRRANRGPPADAVGEDHRVAVLALRADGVDDST